MPDAAAAETKFLDNLWDDDQAAALARDWQLDRLAERLAELAAASP